MFSKELCQGRLSCVRSGYVFKELCQVRLCCDRSGSVLLGTMLG